LNMWENVRQNQWGGQHWFGGIPARWCRLFCTSVCQSWLRF